MSTQIVGFNNMKADKEELSEQVLKEKVNNLTEEDEDTDSIVLNMSDLSELAEAMALVKAGLDRISEITQVDISDEAVNDIVSTLS